MTTSVPSTQASIILDEKDLEASAECRDSIPSLHGKDDLLPAPTREAILAVPGLTADVEAPGVYIVSWDGPDDKANPLNFSVSRRWLTVANVSLITFVTPLASSMFAPSVPTLMKEFGVESPLLSAFVVSVFILGFVIGPVVCSPLSELYGRLPIYHCSNVLFFLCTIACAESRSLNMLIGFRFLAGCAGAAALAIGGGTIADVIPVHHRGKAMVLFSMGPVLGPVVGPVGGGFAVQALGWRWIFWILTILSGCITVLTFAVMRETFAPTLLGRKTTRMQKDYPKYKFRSQYHTGMKASAYLRRSLVRPLRMLVNPIVLILSIYLAVGYGYLYILFTTFAIVFRDQYGFSPGTVGLSFLGCGIGSLLGAILYYFTSDRILDRLSKATGPQPEHRAPLMCYGAILMPIGLFMYGWAAEKQVHWIVPIIGTGIFGHALVMVFQSILNYIVDTFDIYSASALAANMVLRSLGGAFLPLAGEDMYATLGLGWGNSLLAFIAVALVPVPFAIFKYGHRIRAMATVKI
ncbi:hypothetical protein VF21_07311 [Pseudogymnoascus sp. 05NY08]|nr:hypothetical protein VF21_07311 [Pseudogymnoascus sp. 05NY08]